MTPLFEHLDDDEREAALSILRVEIARRRRRASRIAALTKFCPVCAEQMPVAEFASDATRGDGLDWRCLPCRRKNRSTRVNE